MSSHALNEQDVRSRAQRVLDRCGTSPMLLAPDDPIRILHEALELDMCSASELEEARGEASDLEDRVERLESIRDQCAMALDIKTDSDSDEFVKAIATLRAAVPDDELPDMLTTARDKLTELLSALEAQAECAKLGKKAATVQPNASQVPA